MNAAAMLPDFELPQRTAPPTAVETALYIIREHQGVKIRQRRSDGYVDATAMSRAYRTDFAQYVRTERAKAYLEAVSSKLQKSRIELVEVDRGHYGGTWIERRIAFHLAFTLSPEFAAEVAEWFFEWNGEVKFQAKLESLPFEVRRLIKTLQPDASGAAPAEKPPVVIASPPEPEPPIPLLDVIMQAVEAVLIRKRIATRDDLLAARNEIRAEIKPIADGVNQTGRIAITMQTDLWGFFKLDPAAIQRLQKEHDRQRKDADRKPPASGLPPLATEREPFTAPPNPNYGKD